MLLYVNIRLGFRPELNRTPDGVINQDVLHQLYFLKEELHKNQAGEQMQQLYPEGFLFIYSLYALTWYDLVKDLKYSSPYYKEAIQEMDWVVQRIESDEAKSIFSEAQEIEYGAFYTGWSNMVLGRKLLLQKPVDRSVENIRLFKLRCENIAGFIKDSETPFATSYANQAWPADMVICVTSLAMYNHLFEPKYQYATRQWIKKVQQRLDTVTGLIPHYVHAQTGYPEEGARGSSQSLINCFLPEIDSVFANNQFVRYKQFFLTRRLGLPGIREYPEGEFGVGDIDSGPVIWGIGGAASVVGLRVMSVHTESDVAVGLRNSIEGFGVGWTSGDQKKYLFGILPIADAFIGWANSGPAIKASMLPDWRRDFLIYSTLTSLVIYLLLYCMWRKNK
ncbi:hypothetical protein [Xanthocytophaga flava]|uniref:hypothetical protein n=1 Tax=Xanthocytophaga flava TaxID=3048013 RepID=UPI0028D06055|nr:hypothetical protein [Xanthocytophaga flavus]MDJ1472499.1 hypothetical protein [Xanthocytophaga flavus]